VGNPSRPDLHPHVVKWGMAYGRGRSARVPSATSSALYRVFEDDLKQYFRLAALSRNTTTLAEFSSSALSNVFRVRVALEKAIAQAVETCEDAIEEKIAAVLANNFFGFSKKQGTSLRMPLSSCTPTALCGAACYAHDVLDAAPYAVIRGAINGWLAETFEKGNERQRRDILTRLIPHVRSAVRNALKELATLPSGFDRRAFVRFSHVGEIVRFPEFANALANLMTIQSNGQVDCVVYTRHKKVRELNPDLWIINFTLDPSSMNLRYVPPNARIVFSAFGGVTSEIAEVNFLEHHRHGHSSRTAGNGPICPATAPETLVRTCDACRCNRCFVKPT
jgi:hypothetical protein